MPPSTTSGHTPIGAGFQTESFLWSTHGPLVSVWLATHDLAHFTRVNAIHASVGFPLFDL